MKNLAFALVFSLVSVVAVSAQTTKTKAAKNNTEIKEKQEARKEGRIQDGREKETKSPDEKAEFKTARMTRELGLSPDQAARVKELNLQKIEKMASLKEKYGEDRKAMAADMKAIKTAFEADLKTVLSAEQFTTYQKQQEEKRAKMKDRKKGNPGPYKSQQKAK